MNFVVIIPARFFSTRLPGKPLISINGKPMVIHVIEKARLSGANRVIVATDHSSIFSVAKEVGCEVCLTDSNHRSGTERLQEVINHYNFPDDQVSVNVQVDEPFIPSSMIRLVAESLVQFNDASMTTLATPLLSKEEVLDYNVVKVVIDVYSYAIYFSRYPLFGKDQCVQSFEYFSKFFLRHIGIYAYRAGFVRCYSRWTPSPIEKLENLEQLRLLWYGKKVYVNVIQEKLKSSINSSEDL